MNNDNEVEIDVPEENITAGLPVVVEKSQPLEKRSLQGNNPVTAAQAKVEAIADLTHSAYQKAGTLDLTKEESEALTADFPDEAFKPGADGKENLIYIEHAFLRDRLSKVFGMGKWAIIPRRSWSERFILPARRDRPETPGERVYVEAMLVIRGCFVAEAIGDMAYYPSNNAQNYGDAVEGAKTAALRRCCKEFGVGLQAWKKDWCQGWMDRKMAPGKRVQPTPGWQPPVKPHQAHVAPKMPTDITRNWMIDQLNCLPGSPNEKLALEYFQKVGQLLPTEGIKELPLRFVPCDKKQMDALANCLSNFEAGGDAVRAFEPHGDPSPTKKPTVAESESNAPPGGYQGAAGAPEDSEASGEEWYNVIVPIPHKGQKRDEYLKNPDTIGSLYDARHDDEDARKRLWGFATNYEPKGWEKRDGTKMPPSKSDIEFRKALDQFNDWFEHNHPDEKL